MSLKTCPLLSSLHGNQPKCTTKLMTHQHKHEKENDPHWTPTMPKHWRELTHTQCQEMVLESHVFLKEKQDGKTKARTVAGGNQQRGFIREEDASSPAVVAESVILTCI
jgi:hypothetical protein